MKQYIFQLFILFLFISCQNEDPIIEESESECSFNEVEISVIKDLNELTTSLDNTDPESVTGDLNALINYIGDTDIVGMGEATHGTSEFFTLKDKIFRSLVTDKNFNAIVFEIPWGNALVVNDYVLEGKNDADSVFDQTWYWVYDTQETIDLANWMYAYNLDKNDLQDKIQFLGCDPQGPNFEIEKQLIFDYLRNIDPVFKDSVYGRYIDLDYQDLMEYDKLPIEEKSINAINVDWVYTNMRDRRESLVSLTDEFSYEKALMASHVIKHREFMYRKQSFGQTRDSLMAIYSSWWQRILPRENSKIGIWAHNLHVMDNQFSGSKWMGTFLRNERGSDGYKNIGFSFGRGELNAFVANASGAFQSGVRAQTLGKEVCGTMNAVLTECDHDQFYVVFDELEPDSKSSEYFQSNNEFYQTGAGFNPLHLNNYTSNVEFSNLWDVIIHIDDVEATKLE